MVNKVEAAFNWFSWIWVVWIGCYLFCIVFCHRMPKGEFVRFIFYIGDSVNKLTKLNNYISLGTKL